MHLVAELRIKLKAEENSLAFRLSTGIPYSQPGIETGYYYRLKGVDKEWKAVSPDNRLISYPYLKWGSYELQIGYYDKGNRTIKIKRTIDIKIAAPWYQTWWFRLMLALVVTYIIFQLYTTTVSATISEWRRKTGRRRWNWQR